MAAGVLTVTLDTDGLQSDGTQLISTGTITFSSDYDDTDGDSFDPASMGLNILVALDLEMAPNAGKTIWVQPALVEALPATSHLFYPTQALLHIKALGIPDPQTQNVADNTAFVGVTSGSTIDLSGFTGRYRAWGT